MSVIQDEFNKGSDSFTLAPGEYEGPLVINRPCTFDGSNATLWAQSGPVLTIESTGVTVKNCRIEIAGPISSSTNSVAIFSSSGDTILHDVEVKGTVVGINGENEKWDAPSLISLGEFAAEKQNSFTYEITVPIDATIDCKLRDVEISPTKLSPGKNTLLIKTASLRDNTILYGEILLKSIVNRRIYLLGRSRKNAAEHNETPPVSSVLPISEPVQMQPPDIVIAPSIPDDQNIKFIGRGQRVSISDKDSPIVKVVFEQNDNNQNTDIDPYVFRVGSNGKVTSDDDLVYFGNPEPMIGDVKVVTNSAQTIAIIDLSRTPSAAERYAVCFSIYEESGRNFSTVHTPFIRIIISGKEIYRFNLEDLSNEKTVVAIEIYRHSGTWRINAVGRGYLRGLARLCEEYGVNVE